MWKRWGQLYTVIHDFLKWIILAAFHSKVSLYCHKTQVHREAATCEICAKVTKDLKSHMKSHIGNFQLLILWIFQRYLWTLLSLLFRISIYLQFCFGRWNCLWKEIYHKLTIKVATSFEISRFRTFNNRDCGIFSRFLLYFLYYFESYGILMCRAFNIRDFQIIFFYRWIPYSENSWFGISVICHSGFLK